MPIVTTHPELRFEYKHGKTLTVLEGEELQRLISKYFATLKRQRRGTDWFDALLVSALAAFKCVYGRAIVSADDLDDLSTADARKMDLFYRGMYIMAAKHFYPEEDWESVLHPEKTFLKFAKSGKSKRASIDANAAIERLIKRMVKGRNPEKN